MFIASSSDPSGDEPGFQSVATAIGTPWSRNACDGRRLRLVQRVEGAGQRTATLPASGQGFGIRVGRHIPRDRPKARHSAPPARAAGMAELFGMQLDRQAQRARGVEDRAICAVSKAIPSQNPSTASTSPSACAAFSAGMQTSSI